MSGLTNGDIAMGRRVHWPPDEPDVAGDEGEHQEDISEESRDSRVGGSDSHGWDPFDAK